MPPPPAHFCPPPDPTGDCRWLLGDLDAAAPLLSLHPLLVNQPYGRKSTSMTIQVSIQDGREIETRGDRERKRKSGIGGRVWSLHQPSGRITSHLPLLSRDCLIIHNPPPPRVESLVSRTFTPGPTCQCLKSPKLDCLICKQKSGGLLYK